MKTTRQRILEYIQNRQVVTTPDLSQALQMTEANARHHLAILEDQGWIEVVGQRLPQGKGRPAKLFGLTTQVKGHNLGTLASALLNEITHLPPAMHQAGLRSVAHCLASDHPLEEKAASPQTYKPTKHLTQQLFQAVQALNELHYQARWEAHTDAPHIILGHCPYAAIIPDHPELCLMDAYLLEELLDNPVVQLNKLTRDNLGITYCLFQIRN